MARRATSRRPLRLPSLGDMRDPIELIESRALNGLNVLDPYNNDHTEVTVTVFAKVEDVTNRREFDGVDIEERPTHKFTIRYREGVSSESTFTHRGDYYRVVSLSHLDERREFMVLLCKLKGGTEQEAAR